MKAEYKQKKSVAVGFSNSERRLLVKSQNIVNGTADTMFHVNSNKSLELKQAGTVYGNY